MIYLDYAANTPVEEEVLDTYVNATRKYIANPNSSHTIGREAKEAIDKVSNDIAKYFDRLTDNNMIELLVYIENIRPQSIKELENDTIYINMELFNDDTFNKVLDFVKQYI